MMRRAIILALLVSTSGCFTSWAITQATGAQRGLDEGMRDVRVHEPGVREHLHVSMPPSHLRQSGFACKSTQAAADTVHRSGFRYGKRFKIAAVAMFVAEAAIASAVYFAGDLEKPGAQLTIGYFGLDAVGTAVLALVPRKEVYYRDTDRVYSTIRTDCPAGITVEIAGTAFPVDAAGQIGEAGEEALAVWRRSAPGPLRVTYRDRTMNVDLWQTATFEVPMGTLTQVE